MALSNFVFVLSEALLFFAVPGISEEVDGNIFVFSLPTLPWSASNVYVCISSTTTDPCDTSVTVPNIGFQKSVTTTYQQVTVILPSNVYITGNGLHKNTVTVQSECNVNVHVLTTTNGDGFTPIPTTKLGQEYYVVSYRQTRSGYPSFYAVSALEEYSSIYIETSQGSVSYVLIPPFQTYLYESSTDVTGTRIHSNQSVAIMAGVRCADIPISGYCDAILEQLPPMSENAPKQDFHFALAPFLGRTSGYIYRILATCSNTLVSVNNNNPFHMSAGEIFESDISSDAVVTVSADYPVILVQYSKSRHTDGSGDSSMVIVPPVKMDKLIETKNTSFGVIKQNNYRYYINTMLKCKYLQGLTLDESISMSEWNVMRSSDEETCVVRGEIIAETHTIGHPDDEAVHSTIVYGMDIHNEFAYAYPVNIEQNGITTNPTKSPIVPTLGPSAVVDCTNLMLTVYIPRNIIGENEASHIHFIDETCVGSHHNSTHVLISTTFNHCGTTMQVLEDFVVFANTVIDQPISATPGNIITRDRHIEIPVECRIERDGLGSISFHPDASKIVFHENGYGVFSFNLSLYEDQSYYTPFPSEAYPIDVRLQDMLYFEACVSAESGLELFVETCMATATTNPTSYPQYIFIDDGCSKDNTLQHFQTDDPLIDRFGLEAFAFVGIHAPVYVHCYLKLCNISDYMSRCAQGCISKINKRESHAQTDTVASSSRPYVMSQGPIALQVEESPMYLKKHDNSESGIIPDVYHLLIVTAIAVGALCLTVTIGVVLKNRRKNEDYYVLATVDECD